MGSFGEAFQSIAQQISSGLQSTFSQAFDGIISGSMTMGGRLFRASSVAWERPQKRLGAAVVTGCIECAFHARIVGPQRAVNCRNCGQRVITQAYATLVAFYAWSGPAAPVLAAATIGAAIAGIAALANQAVGAFKGVTGLAKGGIVTGPTLAMMGEGGRREAVIPLERDNVIADSVGSSGLRGHGHGSTRRPGHGATGRRRQRGRPPHRRHHACSTAPSGHDPRGARGRGLM